MSTLLLQIADRSAAAGFLERARPGAVLHLRLLAVRAAADGVTTLVVDSSGSPESMPGRAPGPADAPRREPELVSLAFGLEHDPLAELFFLRGEPLELSTQQYRLLAFLALHPRRVLGKPRLLEAVWGWESAGESEGEALIALVARLRQRLGPVAARLIEARHGGYCLVPEPRAT